MTTPIYPGTPGIIHHIPMGCTCSYTWGNTGGTVFRNGPMPNCPVHSGPRHCAMCGEPIQIHICQGTNHLRSV